ncbi:hypothetical protein H632_c3612p0, partial [Helicosporidium sp. ATCC 50920]
ALAAEARSVQLAAALLVKVLMQALDALRADPEFYALWAEALGALRNAMAVRCDAVAESVPENVKNMLLVLATQGVLRPDWVDQRGRSLWDLTFSVAHDISSGLNPGMLAETGAQPQAHLPALSPDRPGEQVESDNEGEADASNNTCKQS